MSFRLALTALVALAPSVAAQHCEPEYLPGNGYPGMDQPVSSSTLWDPDGPGPDEPLVVVGGRFNVAGDALCRAIATWDGHSWAPLGSYWYTIEALATGPAQELFAVGTVPYVQGSPSRAIARWTSRRWEPITADVAGTIHALAVMDDGSLVAGGDITWIRQAPVSDLAHWTGSSWTSFAGGINGVVRCLERMPGGRLLVGGQFSVASSGANNIMAWNGTEWETFGIGLPDQVVAVAMDADSVLAATSRRVWRWENSSWTPVGEAFWGTIKSLCVRPDRTILVGGNGLQMGDSKLNGVARWTGLQWISLDQGLSSPGIYPTSENVQTICTLPDNSIVAAGDFRTASGEIANNIAYWNNTTWSPMGSGDGILGSVVGLTSLPDGRLAACGGFERAGGVQCLQVGLWDGENWSPMGLGITGFLGSTYYPTCIATSRDGDVYVGGQFDFVDGRTARDVARWDGRAWHPMGSGIGTSIANSGRVHSMAPHPSSGVYVGGVFTLAGGVTCNSIAYWNGQTWAAVGGGVFNGPVIGSVSALLVLSNGDLIVGGIFDRAGNTPVKNIAKWNGVEWLTLGSGCNKGIACLQELRNGDIIAGGVFTSAGDKAAMKVARWDGSNWHAMGAGLGNLVHYGYPNTFYELPDGGILAGGSFTNSGTAPVLALARWTGSEWVSFGPPINGDARVEAIHVHKGIVHIAGSFRGVGGVASMSWARFKCACYANCDASPLSPRLTANDLQCFLNRFASADAYANCDGSTTPPTLTANDFQCFLNRFAAGCP